MLEAPRAFLTDVGASYREDVLIIVIIILVAVSIYRLIGVELQRVVGQLWHLLLCLLGQATC